MSSPEYIGSLLVKAGIISLKTLERALEMQKGNGKRLGELLTDMGIVKEEEIVEALSEQCNLKKASNFADRPFPRKLLDLIPAELALEKMIFPLKQHDGSLELATLDPLDQPTFVSLARKTGLKIILSLATSDDILAAISKNYQKGKQEVAIKQMILLVGDETGIMTILEENIIKEGYRVLVAANGMDGLKMSFAYHPELIICDLQTPRMHAYDFIHTVKAHPEMTHIPLILLTSKSSYEEEHRALKEGFIDVIAKPAMPVRVIASINRVFALAGKPQSQNQCSMTCKESQIPTVC